MSVTFLKPGKDICAITIMSNANKLGAESRARFYRKTTMFHKNFFPIIHLNFDGYLLKDSDLSNVISEELLRHSELITDEDLTYELRNLYANTITRKGIYLDEISALTTLVDLLSHKYYNPVVIIDKSKLEFCSKEIKKKLNSVIKSVTEYSKVLLTLYISK
jgi:hypothetical protein